MIQVHIHRTKQGIQAFRMTGHAGYAEHGKDLVCAGASAVAVGTVNALEAVCGISAEEHTEMESGFLRYSLPTLSGEAAVKAQALLEGMLVSLQTIETVYGDFIQIHQKMQEV